MLPSGKSGQEGKGGKGHKSSLIRVAISQIEVSLPSVCPVIDYEFRHNIFKVAVDG